MSKFDLRPQEISRQISEIESVVENIGKQKKTVDNIKKVLSEMSGMQDVIQSLDIVSMSMNNSVVRVTNSADVLNRIVRQYESTEQKLFIHGMMTGDNPFLRGVKKAGEGIQENKKEQGKRSPQEVIIEFFNGSIDELVNNTNDTEILGIVESVGGNKEAGILKKVISYLNDFKAFFGGDKKGLTGAGAMCSLTKSSISAWSSLYKYFGDKYKGVTTGFFGKAAKKNVGRLGVTASAFGLASKILYASDGLGKKEWQDIWADYIDCGKELVSIGESGYALKHIEDVKSSLSDKAGIWSKTLIYEAVADAGIGAAVQGFRSQKKYYADGKWDLGDTGATFVDIAMSGIGGLCHKLTFGLDEVIFAGIDKMAGGKGDPNLNYYERAAEEVKKLSINFGKRIRNKMEGEK